MPDDKGLVTTKPFGECSVEQMRRALQRKRRPASSKPLPPQVETLADQYREAVTGRLPRGTRVKVLLRNERRGGPLPPHGGGPRGNHRGLV